MLKEIFLLGLFLAVGTALDKCPGIKFDENQRVDVTKMLGTWYEMRSSAGWWDRTTRKCFTQEVLLGSENFSFKKAYNNKAWFGKREETVGTLEFSETFREVTYHWKSWGINKSDGPYYVLGTDYENYLVIWKCDNHFYKSYTTDAIIFGRKRDIPIETYQDKINAALEFVKESMNKYNSLNQSGC